MGAWIEIIGLKSIGTKKKSHPTMGAWIEIIISLSSSLVILVAPHDGCVD